MPAPCTCRKCIYLTAGAVPWTSKVSKNRPPRTPTPVLKSQGPDPRGVMVVMQQCVEAKSCAAFHVQGIRYALGHTPSGCLLQRSYLCTSVGAKYLKANTLLGRAPALIGNIASGLSSRPRALILLGKAEAMAVFRREG